MNEYYYYVDELMKIWRRTRFVITAENKEEANEKTKSLYIEDGILNDEINIVESEFLYGSEEPLSVEMNDGYSTVELYSDEDDTLLYENGE